MITKCTANGMEKKIKMICMKASKCDYSKVVSLLKWVGFDRQKGN